LQFIHSSKTVQSHSSSLRTIDQSHRLATIFVAYLALVIGHVEVDISFFEWKLSLSLNLPFKIQVQYVLQVALRLNFP